MMSERSKTKRINVVWLHSYKIPEISNYSTGRRKQIHACLGINGGGGGQVGGIITRTRKCLGGKDMFSILTVLLVSWVSTYLKGYQIVPFNYLQLIF